MPRIRVEENGPILEVTMDHPPANAIDEQASRDLDAAFIRFRDDARLRVCIVTAAGDRFFTGGWDLKAVARGEENEEDFGEGGFMGLTERFDLTKPVICAVNGMAAGGGFEIALASDIVVAAEHADFMLPEALRGFIPEAGGLIRVTRRLPRNIAIELLVSGRRLTAAEAHRFGFVNHLAPRGKALEVAREVAQRIVAAAPLAVGAILEVARATESVPERQAFEVMRSGLPVFTRMRTSQDRDEGPRSFVEKRAPVWLGR